MQQLLLRRTISSTSRVFDLDNARDSGTWRWHNWPNDSAYTRQIKCESHTLRSDWKARRMDSF